MKYLLYNNIIIKYKMSFSSNSSFRTSTSSDSNDLSSDSNPPSVGESKIAESKNDDSIKQDNIEDVKLDNIKNNDVIQKTTIIVEDPLFHRKRRAVKKVLLHPIFGLVVLAAAITGIVCGVVLGKKVYDEPDIPSNDIVS